MSGVYIPDMGMPENCTDCKFMDELFGTCIALNDGSVACFHGKADWCPLVFVPEHGRLVDERWLKDAMVTTLEALKKNPKMDRQEMHLIAAFDTLRVMLEDAPTIIPADSDKEDE